MKDKKITVKVGLSAKNIPKSMKWENSDSPVSQEIKAIFMTGWDKKENSALLFNLWTEDMRVDEMHHFFYQSLLGMAADFQRATGNEHIMEDMKSFCDEFARKTDPSR